MNQKEELKKLKDELVEFSKRHSLYTDKKKIVFGRGSCSPKVLFVGEAPGKTENEKGLPFVGKSGILLDEHIKFLGLNGKDFAITNAVFLLPDNDDDTIRAPTEKEINDFNNFLLRTIKITSPKFIVLLGKIAARACGFNCTLADAGRFLDERHYYVPHPAYLLRNNSDGLNFYKLLKEKLAERKTMDVLVMNEQIAKNLGFQEMVSPLIASLHFFCKKAGLVFNDVNQKDECIIDGKRVLLVEKDTTTTKKGFDCFVFFEKKNNEVLFSEYCGKDNVVLPINNFIRVFRDTKTEKVVEKQGFTPIHFHTEYSIGDGYGSPKQIAEALSKKGFASCAITDHGTLSGSYYFQKALKEKGIKPIIGMEAYIVTSYEDRTVTRYHATIWVKNKVGWKNLLWMNNRANDEGFYYKPRILLSDLIERHEGLMLGSGCMQGMLSKNITDNKFDESIAFAVQLKKAFCDDFFLEIMPHYDIAETKKINEGLFKVSKQLGIKMIFSNDSHYIDKTDKEIHNAIKAISMRKKYGEANYTGNTYYYMQRKDIEKTFSENDPELFSATVIEQMLDDTNIIANACNFSILPFTENILPNYSSSGEKLKRLTFERLEKNTGYKYEGKVKDRIDLELDRFISKGYSSYFLAMTEIHDWAKEQQVLCGIGRGSVGSSLVAMALGLHKADPIKYDLHLERFISEQRIDMPDIDADFEADKRKKVIKFIYEHFGKESCAKVITFSTWHGKGALRDVGRIFDVPKNDIERMCKLVIERSSGDARKSFTLVDSFEQFEQAKTFKKNFPQVCKIAVAIESKIRHLSVSAASIVIFGGNILEACPVTKVGGEICVSFEKYAIEELGLIKFDILGLKNLTVINECLKMLQKDRCVSLPTNFDDKKVYETVFKNGNTLGVFQFETVANSKMSKSLKIDNFDLLVTSVTLGKPGSLHSGVTASFIKRRNGREEVVYEHPVLESITKNTYGYAIFQEQVMSIMYKYGGLSWSAAEAIRKVISKSKGKEMFGKYKKEFCANALRIHKIPMEDSEKLYNSISFFGSYSMNKSHSLEYAIVSYYCAWLKTYYTKEFYITILKHQNNDNTLMLYLNEMKNNGCNVETPHINISDANFTTVNNCFYMGLLNIKGIGTVQLKKILKNRPFSSIKDFCEKVKPSIGIFKALIVSNCFREFSGNTRELYENAEAILKGNEKFKEVQDWDKSKKIMMQSKYIPILPDKTIFETLDDPFKNSIVYEKIGELEFEDYVQERFIKGIVTYINFKQEGLEGKWTMFDNVLERRYAHLNIFDGTGNVLVHLSPEQYTFYKNILERVEGIPVIVKGHSIPDYNKIYCDAMIILDDIDYSNPITKYFKDKRKGELESIELSSREMKGVIQTVSYKVSKKKNPYVRINLVGQEGFGNSLLCFKLDKDIFIAGEIIVYTQTKKPFIDIIRRIK